MVVGISRTTVACLGARVTSLVASSEMSTSDVAMSVILT